MSKSRTGFIGRWQEDLLWDSSAISWNVGSGVLGSSVLQRDRHDRLNR